MTSGNSPRRHLLSTLLAAAGLLLGSMTASADTFTWTGAASSTWNLAGNWTGGGGSGIPGGGATPPDSVLFNSSSTANLATTLDASFSIATLTIANPTGAVSIASGAGTNTLSLTGATGIDMSAATQNLLISAGVLVAANQNWNVGTGAALSVTGTVGLGTSVLTINNGTAGSVSITGIISGSAGAGTPAINIAGGRVVLNALSTYTGQTNVASGAILAAGGIASTGAANSAFGAGGAGNEVLVASGGTVNVGGTNLGTKIFQIAGTGVGGAGALINSGASQQNSLQFVTLTADATVAGGAGLIAGTYLNQLNASLGRFDLRLAAYTAGANNLALGANTLTIGTATGGGQFSLVNADVSGAGSIVVNNGILSYEANTQLTTPGSGSITVNPLGILSFFSVNAAVTAMKPITVNGGIVGDFLNTSANQTIPAAITVTGSQNPVFQANANTTTFSGVVSQSSFTGTSILKRGGGALGLNNIANSFSAPLTIYQGRLQGDYLTAIAGGVAPAAPATTTDTPLGTASTIFLAGGTLGLRANFANDNTNQVLNVNRSVVADWAPSGVYMDRIANASQTEKNYFLNAYTIQPPSALNGYTIGQNQLSMTQTNNHRVQIGQLTAGNTIALNAGDFTFTDAAGGNTSSGGITNNGNALVKIGDNSWGIVGGTVTGVTATIHTQGNLRVGSMFGTALTNNTVTLGAGPIFIAPNANASFRAATNFAPNQIVEVMSTPVGFASLQMDNSVGVNPIPAGFRSLTSGVIAFAGGTFAGTIDQRLLGDGTFWIGTNLAGGPGSGTLSGTVLPGVGNVVRAGSNNGGRITLSGTNAIGGAGSTASFLVGAPLFNGSVPNGSNITNGMVSGVTITATNNYTGGTTINRGSVVNAQVVNGLGTGPINLFGTLQLSSTATTDGGLVNGGVPTNTVNFYGGGGVNFDNSALTGSTTPDRWGDAVPIPLVNGSIAITGINNTATTTNETIGDVTLVGGNTITVSRNAAGTSAGWTTQLTMNSLTRPTGSAGTVEFGRSGGTGAGFSSTASSILITTPPTVTNGMVAPFITVLDNTRLTNFATYSGGIRNVTYTNQVNTAAFPTGLTAGTEIVYIDFASGVLTTTISDSPSIYALKIGMGNTAGTTTTLAAAAGQTMTIRSGGLIISGDSSTGNFSNDTGNLATISAPLIFNDGTAPIEAVVNVRSGKTGVFTGVITAAGLTKFGAGTMDLRVANTLTGAVTINAGIIQSFGPTATGTQNNLGTGGIVLAGGQLNLRSNASAVTGTITQTFQNNGVTVLQNIPTATIDINRSSQDTASTGTFTFNPAAASSPGLILQGSPGEQGQTLNISGGNYNISFGTNALNSFTGNVTFNLTGGRTLTLNNSPSILGTSPVVTKSGDGTMIVGSVATPAGTTVSPNTSVVINAGTLELRSVLAVGTGDTTRLVLNGGTLNLRRDSSGTYGTTGSGAAYPIIVNGNSTISTDRTGGTATNYAINLGALTINGNPTVTFTNANGIYPTFPTAQVNGSPYLLSNVGPGSQDSAARFNGAVSGGMLIKSGTGHLHLMAANTYDGGTVVQQGVLRVRAAGALGTGNVVVNPGANIDFNSTYAFAPGQTMTVRGTSAFIPMISMNADAAFPTAGVNTTQAPFGIVGLSNAPNGVYSTAINLGSLYGGRWSLGGVPNAAYDPRYTASSLGVGLDNLYRLGGGGTSFFFGVNPTTNLPYTNLLTGANDVRLGIDSSNILPVNMTNFQYVIAGTQNYTNADNTPRATVIHRGMVARLASAAVTETVNGNPLNISGLSNSNVNVFGSLQLTANATLQLGNTATNAITFHPGAILQLDNNSSFAAGTPLALNLPAVNLPDDGVTTFGRWGNSTPIGLNGALLELIGANDASTTEIVGAVTVTGGSRIRVARTVTTGTTGNATLTLGGLSFGAANSSLTLLTNGAATLGGADGTTYNRLIVSGTPPTVTNGMVDPRIVNGTDASFVTYGATGFINATYTAGNTAAVVNAGLPATAIVDINHTAAVALSDNPVVYALRTNQGINAGGPFNTITIRGGGLIAATNAVTIQPNLVFNNGTSNIEARIFNNVALTLNGLITASTVTKFGSGNLTVVQPQSGITGWFVHAGTLQINDPAGLGGAPVTLVATQSTGGNQSQALAQTNLTFTRNLGTPELVTFTGGPITIINEATIRTAGADDRNLQVPNVILNSTSTASRVAFTWDVPNNRFRATIPTVTVNSDALIRVVDTGAAGDTGRITTGVVNSLVGANRAVTKIGNRTLELAGDNSATFTGGSFTIGQGTVRVNASGALGSSSTLVAVEPGAALEINTPNFSPVATVTQQAGSIERWNLENARGTGNYTLPAGVNLQLNTSLTGATARTLTLSGGTIEGFLYTDHPSPSAYLTVSPAYTINLSANSFLGQNMLQGVTNPTTGSSGNPQPYDIGRLPVWNSPFGNNFNGVQLEIQGAITGAFNLTKTGYDTVILSGANSYNDTVVDMGILRIGRTDALPTTKVLTPRFAGLFDMYGFDQTVAGLGYATAGPNPGGVGVGNGGRVTNSSQDIKTLTVNAALDYTHNGTIEQNVALVKNGAGVLTLGNAANSYRGPTTINAGVLAVGTLANGGSNSSIGASLPAASNLVFGGGTLRYSGPTVSTDRNYTLNGTGGTIEVTTAASTLTVSGVGQGTGGLTKTGLGTLTLSAAQTFTGNTTVSGGTLTLTGSGSVTPSPVITVGTGATLNVSGVTGGFNVPAAQTLQGLGTVVGNTVVDGTIAPGIAPGTPTGTLSITGNATINGTFTANVLTTLNSLIATTGSVTLGGSSVLNLPATNTYLPDSSSPIYTLVTYTGSLTGTFGSVLNLPPTYSVYYGTQVANAITISPVPEPGLILAACAGAAGGLGLIRRYRRKVR